MQKNGSVYTARGPQGFLHILFYSERIVRFVYSADSGVPTSTEAVVAEPREIKAELRNNEMVTDLLTIKVDETSLAVKITGPDGMVLSEDIAVDGGERWVKKKKLWEKGIYGNGEKYSWINQLGTSTFNYNSDVLFHHSIHNPLIADMHTAIPFYLGVSPGCAYGIYFDNSCRTDFDFAKTDPEIISFRASEGNLDYYFIYGPSVDEVVGSYTLLTGRPGLPRKCFLGYHQSRYSYETREEVLSIAENLRKYDIPCDVLYLDIAYMDAYKVFTVHPEQFKDFKGLLKQLRQMGFAVVVIVNPGVKVESGYEVFEEGRDQGYFVTTPQGDLYQGEVWPKPAAYPDFLRSEVRQWWAGLHRELLDSGVEGIWNDMNEPTDFTQEIGTLPDEMVHLDDEGNKRPHYEVHNLYGLLQTRATQQALEQYRPNQRPFVLTRAAFAGSQRYSALWTGDNASTWEHLEISIPMMLNLGLSGYSFSGADVGGYRGDCSGELIVRWTQAGSLLPYFRNHSEIDTARQEPWEYSAEVFEIVRKYIRLRYRFLTYYYNLMRESALKGTPAVRPLFYYYQDDPRTYNISDQFLLGYGVMVCPVLRPGVERRLAYLPEGLWHDYWTGKVYRGGREIICAAPLDTLPLYIRAGTILPQDSIDGSVNVEQTGKILTLHCYAGEEGVYRLYLDDGYSFACKKGSFSEIEYTIDDHPLHPVVGRKTIKEDYPLPELKIAIHSCQKEQLPE